MQVKANIGIKSFLLLVVIAVNLSSCGVSLSIDPCIDKMACITSAAQSSGSSGSSGNSANTANTANTPNGANSAAVAGPPAPVISPVPRVGLNQLTVNGQSITPTGISVDTNGNINITGITPIALSGNTQTGFRDFYVAQFSNSGTIKWATQYGATLLGVKKHTNSVGIVTDSSGNIYVAGYTTGPLISGPSPAGLNTQAGDTDYFIAKFSSSGGLYWIKQVGVSSATLNLYGIALDASGNIYVTGRTTHALPDGAGGTNTLHGKYDYFVAKHSGAGNGSLVWCTQLGAASKEANTLGITVDSSANLYVTGFVNIINYDMAHFSSVGLPNGSGGNNTQATIQDSFVAKYSSTGTLTWLRQIGGDGSTKRSQGSGISVDSTGNIYVGGWTRGGLPDGSGGTNTQNGSEDAYLAKYSSSGTLTWLKQLGAGSFARGFSIVTDSSHIYLAGDTGAGLNGNTQTGPSNAFLAKYSDTGNLSWVKQAGDSNREAQTLGLSVDSSGNVFATGKGEIEEGEERFGTFIISYTSSGALRF